MDKYCLAAIVMAAIAEAEGIDVHFLRVLSIRKKTSCSLERYISEHAIQYKKYQLGD